jgi:DNA repair protein RAD50
LIFFILYKLLFMPPTQSQRSTSISAAEAKLDALQNLTYKQRSLNSTMKEKRALLENAQSELNDLNYDLVMAEKMAKSRELELRREELNREITSLSLQADSRARLDLKRREKQSKQTEMSNL